MAELQPCPFCGCEMILKPVKTIMGTGYIPEAKGKNSLYGLHKRGCQLESVMYFKKPLTKNGATKKWNKRAYNTDT